MKEIVCPICGESFTVEEDIRENECLVCPICQTELIVDSIDPLRIKEVEYAKEDSEEDLFDFEDDEDINANDEEWDYDDLEEDEE